MTAASRDTAKRDDPGQPVQVVDAIRDAITSGEFAPNQRLVEAELSEQFGASRAGSICCRRFSRPEAPDEPCQSPQSRRKSNCPRSRCS